jgi:membrane protein DedA with SNARE-associated domain
VLASIVDHVGDFAYPVLFAMVGVESSGIPVPGETTLIAAALLASQGKLAILPVLIVAAAGAIVGDNIGYLIGRRGGRWLLERPGRFETQRRQVLERGEALMERHGSKAVFFGRWIVGLRIWASWLAGASHMPWPRFVLWNALGGISWACTVGLLIYSVGRAAKTAIETAGFIGLGLFLVAAAVGFVFIRRRHLRARAGQHKPAGPPPTDSQ